MDNTIEEVNNFFKRDVRFFLPPHHRIRWMHPKEIKKVKTFYRLCIDVIRAIDDKFHADKGTPLIIAALLGHDEIVEAFIECAQQTNTDLHTGEVEKFHQFLVHTTKEGDTVFHVAALYDRVNMVEVLLRYASLELLSSNRNVIGKTPLSMLQDPKYDQLVFRVLDLTWREAYTPTSIISIDDIQESKVYSEKEMDPTSYPISNINHTRSSLDKLDQGQLELSANRSTILHLVVKFGDVDYVIEILERHPSLIYMRNSHGETPAYVAARDGHLDILAIMIKHFQTKNDGIELLLTRSIDKNTALHIAVENHHVGLVFWLALEVPRLVNFINDFGESSVYLAAERQYHHIILQLTLMTRDMAFHGPKGRTALHAAAITGSQACIQNLLSANVDLLYVKDMDGMRAWDYAFYHNNSEAMTMILSKDVSFGYEIMTEDGKATVHIAASRGNRETMESLISGCPGCIELTDSKGRNILHLAVENKKTQVIEFIFDNEKFTSLINQKDNDGNTPIHLLMASDIEMMELVMDCRVNINLLNYDKRTPLDMASSQEKRDKLIKGIAMGRSKHNKTRPEPVQGSRMDDEHIKERSKSAFTLVENTLLVATLIATATFAAAFTFPGGLDTNESSTKGTPILLKKAAFRAFIVANTIAFACSCSVLCGHVVLLVNRLERRMDWDTMRHVEDRALGMYLLTGLAMLTMAISFITGTYVVLTPSLGLAIFLCVISIFIICSTLAFPSMVPTIFRHLIKRVRDVINVVGKMFL